jgi:EmrB/QacA subfamily drug resistance transporter
MAHTTANAIRGSQSWLVVLAACISTFVVAYNTTAIMTALPAIKSSLDLDAQTLQWVMNVYMLASAVLIAVMGRFADIFGKMRMFIIGLGVFATGSISIIFAGDAVMMLVGRACQGIGAAGIMSTSVALITVATPEEKRAQALGWWAGTVAFGFAVGPVIGGVLTDSISWRWIFVIDIPLLAIAALFYLWIEKLGIVSRELELGTKIDYLGVALLIVTLGTFVYGLTSGHVVGWTSLQTLSLFAIAVLGGVAFAVRERRIPDPLVDFSFFRHRGYLAGTFGMFVTGITLLGVLYFFNLFVQAPGALGLTPVEAGLSLLPFTLMMFALSLTVPRLLAPYSLHWPTTIGMLALATGFWLMHYTSNQTPYTDLWWKLMILGIGIGLNFSLLPRVGLRSLPDESAGQGSGVINTCLYVGCTVGIAAGGIVTEQIRRQFIGPVIEKLTSGPSDRGALELALAHGSQSQVDHALAQFSPDDAEKIRAAMQDVLDNAFTGVMEMMTIVGLIGAVLCFVLIRGPVSKVGT